MKSKSQKSKELEKGRELLGQNVALVLIDYSKIPSTGIGVLRKTMRAMGGRVMILKKRLLRILLKEAGIEYDSGANKSQTATIFAPDFEKASAAVYAFLKDAAGDKDAAKMLRGVDLKKKEILDAAYVRFVGMLPPREVLLAQLVGTIAAPLKSFMYILQERAKKVV